MPFDPTLPANGAEVQSAELRDNFNALKALIDAIPAGPPGPAGVEGRGIDEVYDNGDGRATVRMTDGATYGPFTIASGPPGPEGTGVSGFVDNGGGSFVIHTTDGQIYGPFTPPAGPPGEPGPQGPTGPGSSGASCQIQIADGNGAFASDSTFYFIQGDGWTSLRCNWPTTDPAIAGALWNNNGVLNVSNG